MEEADRLGYFVKDNTNGKSYDMPGRGVELTEWWTLTLPAVADWWERYRAETY